MAESIPLHGYLYLESSIVQGASGAVRKPVMAQELLKTVGRLIAPRDPQFRSIA
jgi:hypothetical protein